MKILILYFKIGRQNDRVHVNEHLYSFRNYIKGVEFYYFNACNGIPWYLTIPEFDGVIIHYTFLIRRYNKKYYKDWSKKIGNLKRIKGYKIGISQDEYAESEKLCTIFKEFGIRSVFTCIPESDYQKVFPCDKISFDKIETVLAGYIDEIAASRLKKIVEMERPIDLGYRAVKHAYWLGRHSQLKFDIGEFFKNKLASSDLKTDISTSIKDVIHGNKWYKFLLKCRVILGCEGGASLFDPTGEIRIAVEKYIMGNPGATFNEVEAACFPEKDHTLDLITISPRHFESIITKTCQVLVEGEYQGILKPGIHYIELKRDYSNLDIVLEKIHDVEYCKTIAENAYKDIYLSGKYSYNNFAGKIIDYISIKSGQNEHSDPIPLIFPILRSWLKVRRFFEPVIIKLIFPWRYLKIYRADIFRQIRMRRGKRAL